MDISETQYAHFKFQFDNVEQVLSAFEARGAEELATSTKVREHMKALDEKLITTEYLANQEAYSQYDTEFIRAFMAGNFDKAKELAAQYEIRMLPYSHA